MISGDEKDGLRPRIDAWATQELSADDLVEVEVVAQQLADEAPYVAPFATHQYHAPATPPPSFITKPGTDDRSSVVVSSSTLRAAHDDDAYFHPGGRILTIADATLDGWRPEPTIVIRRVRARKRRSWLVLALVALVGPLLLLVAIVMASSTTARGAVAAGASVRTAVLTKSPLEKNVRARITIPTQSVRSLSSSPKARRHRRR